MTDGRGSRHPKLSTRGISCLFLVQKAGDCIELALIQKLRGSQLRRLKWTLSSAVEKIITKIRSVVSERTPRLSTVSLHSFPPQWSHSVIPSQDIFSFRLRTEWRPLIGPYPSRYCALIGWNHSVATPVLLHHKDTAQGPTRGISRLSLCLYDIRTPIIDSLCASVP